jgi:hypothetical protein
MRGFVLAIYSMERGYSVFFDWFYDETGLHEWLAQLMSQAANVGLEPEVQLSSIDNPPSFRNAGQLYTLSRSSLQTTTIAYHFPSPLRMVFVFSEPLHSS